MFTGLVEVRSPSISLPLLPLTALSLQTLGEIRTITPTTAFEGYSFSIANAHSILTDCNLGDSIAVNGVCLTVTSFSKDEGWFEVGLANETLSRTNLGKLGVGSKVNLERAMAGHGRFGGHFVQVRFHPFSFFIPPPPLPRPFLRSPRLRVLTVTSLSTLPPYLQLSPFS